jgi:hypothetical protein
MAWLSDAAQGIIRPEDVSDLILQESVALQVATQVPTASPQFRVPAFDGRCTERLVQRGRPDHDETADR